MYILLVASAIFTYLKPKERRNYAYTVGGYFVNCHKTSIMELKNIVLHQLIKDENSKPTENYSDHLLPINTPDIIDFVNNFLKIYSKRSPTYGNFEENKDEYPFQKYVDSYLTDDDFLNFSLKAMSGLKKAIDIPSTKGGYVIFIHYLSSGFEFIVTTMLDNIPGFTVNENKLNIEKLKTLNLNELVRANRININRWKSGQDSYLTFIKGKRDVSLFFQKFIGNTDLTSSRINANKFRDAFNDYSRENNFNFEKKTEINNKLDEYIRNQNNKNEDVELDSLSAIINAETPKDFISFTQENELEVSGSFRAKNADFRFLKKAIVNGQGFNLKFDRSLIKNGTIERINNDIIIRNVDLDTLDREFTSND